MKKVSVIIVTYNSEKHIFDCLDALYKYNDIGDKLEVIIVDNCSKNFSVLQECLEGRYENKLRIVINTKNGGYGQGNNVGIKYAKAPIVMVMNPDVRLVQPIFKNICKTFEDNKVALYGFQQLKSIGKRGFSIAWSSYWHPIIGWTLTSICNRLGLYFSKYMYVAGACFCLRKSYFEEVGMFDEKLFMYKEEDDIHYRLSKLDNVKMKYNDKLSYLHLHGLYSADKSIEDCSYELMSLKNSIYLNTKRGLSCNQIIKREKFKVQYVLLKDRFLYMFKNNKNRSLRIKHLKIWSERLEEIIHNPNIVFCETIVRNNH